MSPLRVAVVGLFVLPLVVPAQDDDPPGSLFRPQKPLPEGAVARVRDSRLGAVSAPAHAKK